MLIGGLLCKPESVLFRTLADDEWTLTDHLLALVYDQLAVANWQRSKNGQKGRNRPKPLSPLARRGTRQGGGHGRSNDEVKALLSRYRDGLVPG